MQQILNYNIKVERVFHLYQEQGEINRSLLSEEFEKLQEQIKEKVNMPEETETDNKVKDKEEHTASPNSYQQKKKKSNEPKKEIKYLKEPDSNIDIKI